MTEHTELLAMILPPQGRLALATDTRTPEPALVLALEHKAAAGSMTVAGRMDREQAGLLRDALALWLTATEPRVDDGWGQPATTAPAHVIRSGVDGVVEVADESTVAQWLESGAERLDP